MHDKKAAQAGQRELRSHGYDDQPHEPRRRIAQKTTSCVSFRAAQKDHHEPHDQRGHHHRDECRDRQPWLCVVDDSDRDDSVIVPGLVANKITGVSDRFSSASFFAVSGADELPRSIEKPIQANTPPPATEKAASDTPNFPRRRATSSPSSARYSVSSE
jgi:hypothetical protein